MTKLVPYVSQRFSGMLCKLLVTEYESLDTAYTEASLRLPLLDRQLTYQKRTGSTSNSKIDGALCRQNLAFLTTMLNTAVSSLDDPYCLLRNWRGTQPLY